jgi:hypothetical protein
MKITETELTSTAALFNKEGVLTHSEMNKLSANDKEVALHSINILIRDGLATNDENESGVTVTTLTDHGKAKFAKKK